MSKNLKNYSVSMVGTDDDSVVIDDSISNDNRAELVYSSSDEENTLVNSEVIEPAVKKTRKRRLVIDESSSAAPYTTSSSSIQALKKQQKITDNVKEFDTVVASSALTIYNPLAKLPTPFDLYRTTHGCFFDDKKQMKTFARCPAKHGDDSNALLKCAGNTYVCDMHLFSVQTITLNTIIRANLMSPDSPMILPRCKTCKWACLSMTQRENYSNYGALYYTCKCLAKKSATFASSVTLDNARSRFFLPLTTDPLDPNEEAEKIIDSMNRDKYTAHLNKYKVVGNKNNNATNNSKYKKNTEIASSTAVAPTELLLGEKL
jgi:hypothetical protein